MLELLVVVIAMCMLAFTLNLLDSSYPTSTSDQGNITYSSTPRRSAGCVPPSSSVPLFSAHRHRQSVPDSQSIPIAVASERRRYVWRLTVVKDNGGNAASHTSGLLARDFGKTVNLHALSNSNSFIQQIIMQSNILDIRTLNNKI